MPLRSPAESRQGRSLPVLDGSGRVAPPSAWWRTVRPWFWLWLQLCLWASAGPAQALELHFDRALTVEARSTRFPVDAATRTVALPDDWARSRPDAQGPVWYRIRFELPQQVAPDDLMALQIPHVCSTLIVQVNSQLVHVSGRSQEPDAVPCTRPHLIAVPAAVLQAGSNVIDLQVAGYPLGQVVTRHRAAALSDLTLGPLQTLQARHHWQTLLQVTAPQALGATLLLMGGFMFVLGFFNRRESQLAYFGALSVGWALMDARLWLREWSVPHAWVEVMSGALMPLLAWAAVQFLLRYARCRLRWADRLLPVQAALVPLSLWAAGADHLYPMARIWAGWLALQVVAAAAFYLHRQWRDRSASFWLMGSLLGVLAVSGVFEVLSQTQATPTLAAQAARLAVPLMLVLVGLRLVQQHGLALQRAEESKTLLEQRVREATAEIERNFRQLSELKIEQVTERERKRIAADLHDDLGAKLLTIVHTSESDRISTLAREALEEMRLSVRGLTGRPVRLADALGDWRAEIVSRLAQAGIEAEWTAPDDLPQTLSARAYVQTTRILREATSNIIKHSGASMCSVRCQVADGDFGLIVQDNGDGISSEADGRLDRGLGMATMKQRAKQLQGQCLVETGPGYGTVIRLTLPLDRAIQGA
jgi:two-component system, NarL family, sensor histidine kinase UhpB